MWSFPIFYLSFIFITNCTFYLHVNWQINLNITSSKNAKQKQLIGSTEGYIFSRTFLRVRMIAQSVSSCSQMWFIFKINCCILDQQHNGQINGKHNKYLYGAVPFCGILCHHSLFCSEGKFMSIIHNAPEHCMYTYSNPQQFFHFWVIFFPNQKNPLC